MKDKIQEILKDKHEAIDLIAINDCLNLKKPEDLKSIEIALDELIKENIVYKTKKDKYILYANCQNLKTGKISINKAGNGFLLLDGDDLFIDYNNLNNATNGDLVLVEVIRNKSKDEGKVIKILKRDTKNLIGEILFKNDIPTLLLDDQKKNLYIEIDPKTAKNCVDGSKVLVNLVKQIKPNRYIGNVVKVVGHKNDPGVDVKTIAYKYSFFDEFSKETDEQTEKLPIMVDKQETEGRRDLTDKIIFTIDGDDTKDIDDAISLDIKGNVYTLGVHIADVSHYVTKDSPLDSDAFKRGTSAYLANSVIPMLPHKLSNGICSLNPNVVRLAISCMMDIDQRGNIIKYDIFPSYIKSRKQMTYKRVNDILMRNIVAEDYKPYALTIQNMNSLAHILRKNKERRGYIDFDIDEPKILCDHDGKCIDVKKDGREDGEKLIEDFMIAANETVATHVYNMGLPFIYRVHGTPKTEKIDSFIKLVSLMGYHLVGNFHDMKPKSMQKILSQIADKPEFPILSDILLRSMQKAVYSKDNIGHFGLGSTCYTHFTSPIRRYPDLMVHRLLRTYLFENKIDDVTIDYWDNSLDSIALNCSEREQASDQAEREVDDMKMAEYMESHIGEVYKGIITTVTNFGLFVMLDNLIEGLVHINTLEGDFYTYLPDLMSIVGQETKKRYRIGDTVKIKVVSASKEARTIDFVLLDGDKRGNKKPQSKF